MNSTGCVCGPIMAAIHPRLGQQKLAGIDRGLFGVLGGYEGPVYCCRLIKWFHSVSSPSPFPLTAASPTIAYTISW